MKNHDELIHKLYTAFAAGDHGTMKRLYHPEARFTDAVFVNLSAEEVKAMWEMLIRAGADLKISHSQVKSDDRSGSCRWEAWYTFSATGRRVHNVIDARFEFKEGQIFRHTDNFDFWRWSRMALGLSGTLLGWSPFLRDKVRATARKRLDAFIARSKN
jgi:hypothetical protein